ncbi:alpha/beta hydrolase [Stieleria sp. TO1_6]|uniref:alpha/beta hydrolase n=1 Tax=Stieleria tagensis TaxID=2956795 RepID=UPI00209A78C6|nr:alpha/beta hydrolase [Stieleria tagensis]MCO8124490.1 alpha/beta hydrolase [Stieleria tagensis]
MRNQRILSSRLCLVPILVLIFGLNQDLLAADAAEIQVQRDLVFAEVDGQKLKLDLYLPTEHKRPPLVVWIHGGGWRAGSKNKASIKAIVPQGYALASISYRFTDKAIFPAQIFDCKAAIRWLRANADRYGYSADWIAVAGSSAGGHLALLAGVSGDVGSLEGTVGGNLDQSSRVQAIIDYFGPSDFVLRGKTQPSRAYTDVSGSFALLGGQSGSKLDSKIERDASPSHYVSADDPPLLIFHGQQDQVVLMDQSERIKQCYDDAGLPSQLVVLEAAGHGGGVFFRGQPLKSLIEFLDQQRPQTAGAR